MTHRVPLQMPSRNDLQVLLSRKSFQFLLAEGCTEIECPESRLTKILVCTHQPKTKLSRSLILTFTVFYFDKTMELHVPVKEICCYYYEATQNLFLLLRIYQIETVKDANLYIFIYYQPYESSLFCSPMDCRAKLSYVSQIQYSASGLFLQVVGETHKTEHILFWISKKGPLRSTEESSK